MKYIFGWMDLWKNRIIGFGLRKIPKFHKRSLYIQLKWYHEQKYQWKEFTCNSWNKRSLVIATSSYWRQKILLIQEKKSLVKGFYFMQDGAAPNWTQGVFATIHEVYGHSSHRSRIPWIRQSLRLLKPLWLFFLGLY